MSAYGTQCLSLAERTSAATIMTGKPLSRKECSLKPRAQQLRFLARKGFWLQVETMNEDVADINLATTFSMQLV